MACLERLEVECAQKGDIGKVSIIPRAYDSVRVIFSAMHAIDIRFTDKATICVSDAAYHHLYYSSRTTSVDTFIAPQPYLVQAPPPAAAPDYDDYYDTRRAPSQSRDRAARYHDHGPPEMSRREPSIRSGGRRYGNDPSYF